MSDQVSGVPSAPLKTIRHVADFHASEWEDHFLDCNLEFKTFDTKTKEQHEEMKNEVRRMVMDTEDYPAKKLQLIDAVQRLGVAYHFEKEMEDALEKIYQDCDNNIDISSDLHIVSLHFRLLRQQGIQVPCDVFEKFKDDEGKFKASLINDVQGILSLYEAAYFAINGEDILDEALTFTTSQLNSMLLSDHHHLAEQISHALKHPLRKSLPRLEAKFFMSSVYPRDDSHNETLLKFAKLDFNILQALHHKELSDILLWKSKNLYFTKEWAYARDRLVEEYFWALGIVYEPQYAYSIKQLAKVICMMTLIDDTYDAYGTYEELGQFTEAVKRWDIGAIEILPEYMKLIYKALLDLFNEIEEDMAKEGRPYCIHYAKKWTQISVEAYFDEAKWFDEGYVPTFEEYMKVATETACCELLTISSFLGMGDTATKEAFEWVGTNPKIIKASRIIGRLLGDKASHKFEQQREHIPSAIECYIKQHGASEEEAVKVILKQVESAWKDVNAEFLKPTSSTAVPRTLLDRVLNYSRVVELLYMDDCDSFTECQSLIGHVASVLGTLH